MRDLNRMTQICAELRESGLGNYIIIITDLEKHDLTSNIFDENELCGFSISVMSEGPFFIRLNDGGAPKYPVLLSNFSDAGCHNGLKRDASAREDFIFLQMEENLYDLKETATAIKVFGVGYDF